mmetsp:Transcript_23209/g.64340  ORF Transcript_23209/g.64340 Transcript_23209/m.64340 type:complete len:1165 (-) Transcript_23209:85-3579(-)
MANSSKGVVGDIYREENEDRLMDGSNDYDASTPDTTITNGIPNPNGGHATETKQKVRVASKRETKKRRNRRTQRKDPDDDTKSNDRNSRMIAKNAEESGSIGRNTVSKRRRNGRVVRLVSLESKKDTKDETSPKTTSDTRTTSVPPLPGNQYATTLRRRALRKLENNVPSPGEEYGDISLGMNIIVEGGRVIVQSLNSLSDGMASPAQLAGVIQRGDVLLGIGNLSIINLPVDQLMEGLRPLSTPDSGGCYERLLHLRFEAGAGLDLLQRHEVEHARSNGSAVTDPMFSIFPMVDNMSGVHFHETHYDLDVYDNGKSKDDDYEADMIEEAKDKFPGGDETVLAKKITDKGIDTLTQNLDALISATLARERNCDRERYESEYFDWREDFPDLLRRTIQFVTEVQDDAQVNQLTNKERLELGLKIMEITKALELNMEEIDRGRDSNKNWSSGCSLRSSSSATIKRQYNMDGTITTFRSSCDQIDEESIDSDGSFENVDPDTLLLGLAARDSVWRGQLISVLNNAVDDVENCGEEKSRDSGAQNGSMDFTQQFGFLLFRESSSRFPKQKLKSVSFPPPDITRVLFDLTTFIVASANDDFTVFDGSSRLSSNISSLRSVTTKTGGRRRGSRRADIILATHFILDEALPLWLKSFRPLKLNDRMILWPRQNNRGDSVADTYTRSLFENDNQTIGSGGSRSQISTAQSRRNEMREHSDFEVGDHESRTEPETCFLVTYFYTQRIVGRNVAEDERIMNARLFVETYGAYLQIQTCLSHAASVQDKGAIAAILEAARNDPSHQDTVKEIQKTGLMFYDTSKLSAVLQCLEDIKFEMKEERRKELRHLCVSGYPDIQPWQVRDACRCFPEPESKELRAHCVDEVMESLYYSYLSDLMDPIDGHEAARQNFDLVKEFCELSVRTRSAKEDEAARTDNFVNIASRSSAVHEKYRRDLMMLLDLSVEIGNRDLALGLVDEIFEDKKLSSNQEALNRVLTYLRSIGRLALELCSDQSTETIGFEIFRRILSLFEKIACNPSDICRKLIKVPEELLNLFEHWKTMTGSSGDDPKMYFLVDFVIKVSSAPGDVIRALLLWSAVNPVGNSLYSRIEDLLCRGIHYAALNGELSGTLFRLKYARKTLEEQDSNRGISTEPENPPPTTIWGTMCTGNLLIEK